MKIPCEVSVSAALLSLSILFAGCAGNSAGPDPSCESLTLLGWLSLESGDSVGALACFDRAIAADSNCLDAYSGRGWSFLGLGLLESAILDFEQALEKGLLTPDPFAGQAVAFRDADPADFARAIAAADSALSRDKRYVFPHDPSFDWRDLRLIMSQSYFATGLYNAAKAQVDSLFPNNCLDPSSPTFVDDLLLVIQMLGQDIIVDNPHVFTRWCRPHQE